MLGFKKHGKKQNERKEQKMLKFILVFYKVYAYLWYLALFVIDKAL